MATKRTTALKVITLASIATMLPFGVQADSADVSKGKAVYEGTCVYCHGEKGKGVIPGAPDFTKTTGVMQQDDEVLIAHIIDGFESPDSAMPMPPLGGNPDLSDEDVAHVLAYIREEFGTE